MAPIEQILKLIIFKYLVFYPDIYDLIRLNHQKLANGIFPFLIPLLK